MPTTATPSPASAARNALARDIEVFLDAHLPASPCRAGFPKVVHDSLWGTLELTAEEVQFVDTPLVQRLRFVHQTGNSLFTYPSATHARFEHTIGVMRQTDRLARALRENSARGRLKRDDIRNLRLAALFHDVGHGPFSHTSEEVYGTLPSMVALKPLFPGAKSHEILSHLIVTSPRFAAFANPVVPDLPLAEIAGYITGTDPAPERTFKREVINGPFDADKLDYLARRIWEAAGKPCVAQEVWVDLPSLPSTKAGDDTIFKPSKHGRPVSVNSLFPSGQWAKNYGEHKWRGHVFCPDHCRDAVTKAAKDVLEADYASRSRIRPSSAASCARRAESLSCGQYRRTQVTSRTSAGRWNLAKSIG